MGSVTPQPQPIIGLEVHVQLDTRTKLFCGNAAVYGDPPNSHVCPVCAGLPGALPVVNARAVELAVRAALGLGCTVHPRSAWARKHFFYPDLPKGYQITQAERPLAAGGRVVAEVGGSPREVRIRRVHLEEDTAKSLHDRFPGATALDLNRAGIPLIEIVTEPDLRSPEEAGAALAALKQLLQYLEVSDCDMEKGSLRVDVNVSLSGADGQPGARTEVKNLNSFGNVERAVRFEIGRQQEVLEAGGAVTPRTLLWDAPAGVARPLRSKEEARDYRYLPEPDLPPLVLAVPWIEAVRAGLPELPRARVARLRAEHALAPAHAEVLGASRALADYFEAVVGAGAAPAPAASWVLGEVLAAAREAGRPGEPGAVLPAPQLARLLRRASELRLPRPLIRQALRRMVDTALPADRVLEAPDLSPARDAAALERWIESVIASHPEEVRRLREGEARLLGFLVGQVMRRSGGRADPVEAGRRIKDRVKD